MLIFIFPVRARFFAASDPEDQGGQVDIDRAGIFTGAAQGGGIWQL